MLSDNSYCITGQNTLLVHNTDKCSKPQGQKDWYKNKILITDRLQIINCSTNVCLRA